MYGLKAVPYKKCSLGQTLRPWISVSFSFFCEKCSKLFCVQKLFIFLMFVAVGPTLSAVAPSGGKTAGVNQDLLSRIPQQMKSFIDRQTVAGAVTLVAHGSDIVEFD